jgi:hypothetical protein
MPGVASTADASEIRLAFSPDGRLRLWGRVDRDPAKGLEIYQSRFANGHWREAEPAPFNSSGDDFDPFFAPDGRSVLFFSNRPGGSGKNDLWEVPFDQRRQKFGVARNLGSLINSPGEEFAPAISPDGRHLLFASDGHGGSGRLDLFESERSADGSWSKPVNLGAAVNGELDDFDATYVGKDMIVFTSGDNDNGPIALYRAVRRNGSFVDRQRLTPPFNCSNTFNLGPAWNPREPKRLYYSAACPNIGRGRADIFVAPFARK